MKRTGIMLMIATLVLGVVTLSWAIWGFPTSLEGTIKSVSSNMITLANESSQSQELREINVAINSQTRLSNLASVGDLKEGDRVKVEYKEEGNQKVATLIAKQEYDQGEKPKAEELQGT